MRDVKNKVAFITGGASGIGFGMASVFLKNGMKVVMADANEEHLKIAAQSLHGVAGEYHFIKLDVTDRKAMANAADEVEKKFGKLHVLCNNAGIGSSAPISTAGYDDWDHMLNVNLNGVINGIVTFMPRIRAHGEGGHIVNTSSMAGILPLPDPGGVYTASKFAVRGLSESLRLALAKDNIGVSVLFPGLTRTRILDDVAKAHEALDELSGGFVEARRYAMEPEQMGEIVLESILRNDAYILSHGEFVDEVRELHDAIIKSFRTDVPWHPKRAEFERGRRKMIEEIKASMQH